MAAAPRGTGAVKSACCDTLAARIDAAWSATRTSYTLGSDEFTTRSAMESGAWPGIGYSGAKTRIREMLKAGTVECLGTKPFIGEGKVNMVPVYRLVVPQTTREK